MSYSPKRFFGSALSAAVVLILLLYLIASATVVVGSLSVVGIGGFFLSAGELEANEVKAYPVMGEVDGAEAVTDTTVCEERPMIAFETGDASAEDFTMYKDVEVPFFDDWWMTITIDEPEGALEGEDLTFYTTQMEMGTMSVTNVEVTEGGDPGRGADYTPPEDRTTADRSDDVWGPDSGEFLLIGDPVNSTGELPETEVTNIKAWLHAATGENVEFIADLNDPSAVINLDVSYQTTQDLQDRYEQEGIETRNPDAYDRDGYFDCLPGND